MTKCENIQNAVMNSKEIYGWAEKTAGTILHEV